MNIYNGSEEYAFWEIRISKAIGMVRKAHVLWSLKPWSWISRTVWYTYPVEIDRKSFNVSNINNSEGIPSGSISNLLLPSHVIMSTILMWRNWMSQYLIMTWIKIIKILRGTTKWKRSIWNYNAISVYPFRNLTNGCNKSRNVWKMSLINKPAITNRHEVL